MAPFTHLLVPAAVRAALVAHALSEAPVECCGLLAGHIADGVGVVTERYAVANDVASATRYATNPRDMLAAFRAMRAGGTELLAIYHSHPTSAAVPSARDLGDNTYGESVVHVIVGLAGAEPEVRAWWLGETGFREAAQI
ncbi:MAG: M67 family metallopeptidase [Planctomycetes bacterium]|nr:M67 family metallopeptidase [Planctomycetota bacterium]